MEGEIGMDVSPFSSNGDPAILMVNAFVLISLVRGTLSGASWVEVSSMKMDRMLKIGEKTCKNVGTAQKHMDDALRKFVISSNKPFRWI